MMKIAFVPTMTVFLLVLMSASVRVSAAESGIEDRYIASRDAAIKRLNGNKAAGIDDAATKAEEVARADLGIQMEIILGRPRYDGFSAGVLHLDSLFVGDLGFGLLDGLRFDAATGMHGEPVGLRRSDGTFVEPRSHIILTTRTLFARWLLAHPELRGGSSNGDLKHVLGSEAFYTRAISTDAAVFKFADLSIDKPPSADLVQALLAGRSQSEIPDAPSEVFASVLADSRIYIVYGMIKSGFQVSSCLNERTRYVKRLEQTRIDAEKIRQQGENGFRKCFALQVAKHPIEMATASRRTKAMLDTALDR